MRTVGERAVLLEAAGTDEVVGLAAAVRAARLDGVVDVVPGARTVLVVARSAGELDDVRHALAGLSPLPADEQPGELVEVPVRYDGPDLDEVAQLTGLTPDEVVAAHTGTPWTVAFGGFAPGFAYLSGGDPRLDVPRRAEPRARVPAGSVGLAGDLSGVYPRESPGGWQLLGRTDLSLWDLHRDPPALLRPGVRVRFVAVDAPSTSSPSTGSPSTSSGTGTGSGAGVRVVAPGPLTTVQDEGRPGLASLGVGPSGAADRAAHALANRLLANPRGAATLEVTLGGLRLRAEDRDLLLVVTGADLDVRVDGRGQGTNAPFRLQAGDELALGSARAGLRAYVGVRGGWAVPDVLGSRSRDVLAGLGPDPLTAGSRLGVGPAPDDVPTVDVAPMPAPPTGVVVLDLVPGPRDDWLADASALVSTPWEVDPRSDRVGVRLRSETGGTSPVAHAEPGRQLPSEGLVRGALQVPPGGDPVVMLADHPVTGGYPVAGVLTEAAADRAAQLRPGQPVRLRWAPGAR
ncbi:5-oxoprolinase subunit PxpB [Aeromicrobium sp. IC_218]|uniref:5-oxoprolinase subunit PxpB n=1 Tax=Aeromicrobium sp. IC_218 TaxID=2545468 RepID=UPI00103A29FE|nr:5-oxoprolinase subunit PxpB [Aeromicrobium sp. IC_218]TCI99353.1 5-oxoprolinase subunit PxpB [Aeromicrobium sp. IC_218]